MTISHDSAQIGDRIYSVRLNEPCKITYKDDRSIVVEPLTAKTDPRVRATHLLHSQGCYYGLVSWSEHKATQKMIDALNHSTRRSV